MAYTRQRLEAKVNDPTVGASIMKLAAKQQLRKMDAPPAAPPPPPPPPPAAVTPLPVAAPATSQVPPPSQEPPPSQQPPGVGGLATVDHAPPVPQLDDAAARVAAQEPQQIQQPGLVLDPGKKRKRYGLAATTLTGEGGLSSLGGLVSRSILG
jgi:hypothetical protein